ncbi:uncharacterized protein LOC135397939 [Ornithodoros turicata]|uniref:uncharacterized protein LOC135397939 n=1 Tax=Ornithodoros turicata TaxID=34597 RepID=UPI0031395E71
MEPGPGPKVLISPQVKDKAPSMKGNVNARKSLTSVSRVVSKTSVLGAEDDDDISIANLAVPYRDKVRRMKLDIARHKGIIACTAVASFAFATYFLLAAVSMLAIHCMHPTPENSVAVRMGFSPVNIAITLMAMGVGCATLSLSLAYSIEDINWS